MSDAVNWRMRCPISATRGMADAAWTGGLWKRGPFLQRPENMSASRYFATVQRPESCLCIPSIHPLVSGSSGTAGWDPIACGLDGTSRPHIFSWWNKLVGGSLPWHYQLREDHS